MNIHEHQAKKILEEYGAPVSNGVVIYSLEDLKKEISKLKSSEFVLKAQIHAGGRGKAGGVKLIKNLSELENEAKKMMGKKLVTHQTGPEGKIVKRLYIEEASEISKEFYLSCLIDRKSSKIAFISSTEGGMDIEKIAAESPDKIITTKMDLNETGPSENELDEIIKVFKLNEDQKKIAKKTVKSMYEIILKKDASLIEINPLIITKDKKLICLDAKMNFDDNAIFRRPEILKLRDLNEEDPAEIEASKYDLAYIKLNGSIGCMVNGAGLAMAEGSKIDWASHDNDYEYYLKEMQEFEKTVEKALNFAQENNDTLVVVTADHETGGLLIEQDDARYRETGKMKITWNTAIGRGTHTGIMIPVFAQGPGAENFSGVMDNTDVFFAMKEALGADNIEDYQCD